VKYLSDYGLSGTSLEGHLIVLDDVLDPDVRSAPERQELLLDHELLVATAQLHLLANYMTLDDAGLERLTFRHGEWVWEIYDAADLLEFLREEPEHLAELVALVREALFERFRQDASAQAAA
jgi:hypothetical protein